MKILGTKMDICQIKSWLLGDSPFFSFFLLLLRVFLSFLFRFLLRRSNQSRSPSSLPARRLLPLLFFSGQQQQPQQRDRSSCEDRQTEAAARARRSCVFRRFSGHFRRPLLELKACLTSIFSNSSKIPLISFINS